MIYNVKGDLFDGIDKIKTPIIIAHVCNDRGAWGSGFVVPLGEKYPRAKTLYHNWYNNYNGRKLGYTQFVHVDAGVLDNILVANMVAQTLGGMRPLRYDALVKCMLNVANRILDTGHVIHCPRFGSDRAGGNWGFILELIEDCWNKRGIDTIIYSLD